MKSRRAVHLWFAAISMLATINLWAAIEYGDWINWVATGCGVVGLTVCVYQLEGVREAEADDQSL